MGNEMEEAPTTFGSWEKTSTVGDIEQYLVDQQRKFVKYRLNIFYLNRVSPPAS